METADLLRALANARRLQILGWLKDPRAHFPPQVDGDLVADGVCAVYLADKLVSGDRVVKLEERFAPRLKELADDPAALAAASARFAAASDVLRHVEALLGHELGPVLASPTVPGAADQEAPA